MNSPSPAPEFGGEIHDVVEEYCSRRVSQRERLRTVVTGYSTRLWGSSCGAEVRAYRRAYDIPYLNGRADRSLSNGRTSVPVLLVGLGPAVSGDAMLIVALIMLWASPSIGDCAVR